MPHRKPFLILLVCCLLLSACATVAPEGGPAPSIITRVLKPQGMTAAVQPRAARSAKFFLPPDFVEGEAANGYWMRSKPFQASENWCKAYEIEVIWPNQFCDPQICALTKTASHQVEMKLLYAKRLQGGESLDCTKYKGSFMRVSSEAAGSSLDVLLDNLDATLEKAKQANPTFQSFVNRPECTLAKISADNVSRLNFPVAGPHPYAEFWFDRVCDNRAYSIAIEIDYDHDGMVGYRVTEHTSDYQ